MIDDDEPTNFLNEMVLEEAKCAKNIVIKQSGFEGLEYLKSSNEGKYPQPDLIFLDINMPVMNGWEFLEEYEKLEAGQKAKFILVMLTTSLNPDDAVKAKKIDSIDGFKSKPLTQKMIMEIMKEHFPDHL